MCMKQTLLAAALIPAVAGTANAQTFGAFHFVRNADPMSDADRSSIVTAATHSPGSRIRGSSNFVWTCMSDGLNVGYHYGTYLMGMDSRITVQYRFGEAPSTSPHRWNISTDHRTAFLPMEDVAQFTWQAQYNTKITLRVTDRDGDVLTHVFSLEGLRAALPALSCYRPLS